MKKIFLFIVIASAFVACIGPEGPQGPKGDNGANWEVINLVVNSNEWSYSNQGDNNYFSASFNVPELTNFIFDSGLTQCYIKLDNGKSQQLLPYTRHYEEAIMGDAKTSWIFYTRTIDFECAPGKVYIYVTDSDFNYELDNTWKPESMSFRLVLMW